MIDGMGLDWPEQAQSFDVVADCRGRETTMTVHVEQDGHSIRFDVNGLPFGLFRPFLEELLGSAEWRSVLFASVGEISRTLMGGAL